MPMLIARYVSYWLLLSVVFLCFACQSASTEKTEVPAVDSLSQRLDSIGFEPYAQSLITNGDLKNYELVDSYAMYQDFFLKDSLYLTMQESSWAVYGVYWIYSNKNFTFSTSPVKENSTIFNLKNHFPDSGIYNYEFSMPELTYLKGILDSIKLIDQDLNYRDGAIFCSRLKLVYYDGSSFYFIGNHDGESAGFFLEQLFIVFSKYYNKDKSRKKR